MPEADRPYPDGLEALFAVVHRLRAPDGCPWDRAQTHESLRRYLLEEAYEAVDAIDSADDERLLDELGDVLLQVAMHAEIASQEGRFDAARVSEAAAAKMVARHPHVFGDVVAADAEAVLRNWEANKAAQAAADGEPASVVERVPRALPALAWTAALQERAARVGAVDEWNAADADRLVEEVRALTSSHSRGDDAVERFGDALFLLVHLARRLDVDPEDALRLAGRRFVQRVSQPGPT